MGLGVWGLGGLGALGVWVLGVLGFGFGRWFGGFGGFGGLTTELPASVDSACFPVLCPAFETLAGQWKCRVLGFQGLRGIKIQGVGLRIGAFRVRVSGLGPVTSPGYAPKVKEPKAR